jgi:hypothetical protein
MATATTLSSFQFDTGSGLTTIAAVLSSTFDKGRAFLDDTPIGYKSSTGSYGVFRCSGSVKLAFLKASHQSISDQLASGSAAKSVKCINVAGDESTGLALFTGLRDEIEVGGFVVATADWVGTGPWTICGTSTGT